MLARRPTTILPAMRLAEAREPTRIHRVAGLTGGRTAVVTTRHVLEVFHQPFEKGIMSISSRGHQRSSGPGRTGGTRADRHERVRARQRTRLSPVPP
jgi:hypothetical protein